MRTALITLLIVFVAALATPLALEALLEQQLTHRLADTEIERLSLNPFTGRVRVEGVAVDGVGESDLAVGYIEADIDMRALLGGKLVIQQFRGEGLRLLVEQSDTGELAVLLHIPAAEADTESEPLVLPTLTISEFLVTDSIILLRTRQVQGDFAIERLAVTNFVSNSETPAQTEILASWGGTQLSWRGTVKPMTDRQSVVGDLSVEALQIGDLQPLLPRGQRHLETTGSVDIDLAIRLELGEATELALNGDVNISELLVHAPAEDLDILRVQAIKLEQLALKPDSSLSVKKVTVSGALSLDDSERDEQALAAGELVIDDLDYRDARLALAAVHGRQARSVLRVTPAGELQSLGILSATLNALSKSDAAAAAAAAEVSDAGAEPAADDKDRQFNYRIGPLDFQDSVLSFVDERYEPPVAVDINVISFTASGLDSQAPGKPETLALAGRIGKFGTATIEGELAPLSPSLQFNLKGAIEGASLPVFSPYIEEMLGYAVLSGQYDHTFSVSLKDEKLDSGNQLTLRKLEIKKIPGVVPVAPPPVPLGPALDMLRDRQGKIELDVPVKGDLSDPELGTEQIVGRALGKALTAGSTAILKYALQPYGAIWTGLEMGLKEASRIRLDPMVFAPGDTAPGDSQLDYAGKIAGLMKDKPKLQLSICGTVGAADRAWLVEQESANSTTEKAGESLPSLLEIALGRQEALQRYLVEDREIDSRRVYVCKPELDPHSNVSGITLLLEP